MGTMTESMDITISMVMMMETSPENADFHMLFVYIYSPSCSNSRMTSLCHNFLSFLSTFTNEHFIIFYPQLPSSTQSFTLSQTNFTLPLYSLNITSGFSPLLICLSASMGSFTMSINLTLNNLLYSKKSCNMEETKKLVPTHAFQFLSTL
jgi:hypothetical protein